MRQCPICGEALEPSSVGDRAVTMCNTCFAPKTSRWGKSMNIPVPYVCLELGGPEIPYTHIGWAYKERGRSY
jgi:hypothetical protein